MKFRDLRNTDVKLNVDGPVSELLSLGSEINAAVDALADRLHELSKQQDPDISYDAIEQIMLSVCKDHACRERELHDAFVARKGGTPDQYVRDVIRTGQKKMVEDSGFQEFDVFLVEIPANIRAGKHYDYRTVPYRVYKGMDGVNTADDAIAWVNRNQDTVLADIEGKMMRVGARSVPYVKKPAIDNVFFKDNYRVRPSKVSHPVDYDKAPANYIAPTSQLNEGPYDDRVQTVADAIISRSESVPFKREELPHWIEVEADYKRVPELAFKDRKGSRAWSDFVKDVLAAIRGKVKLDRKTGTSTAAADKREKKAKLLATISMYIEDAFGQTFPDGDPMDYIGPKMTRLGIDEYDFSKWLDAATRAHLKARSFDEYMGNMYDDVAADSPELMLQSGILWNPYTNKPFNFLGKIGRTSMTPGLIVNILANSSPSRDPKTVDQLASAKAEIVKGLLKSIKSGAQPSMISKAVRNLRWMGFDWPELNAIETSLQAELREHMLPGDVLMIEGAKEAVVGTILSVDGGTIIIEGGSYPLDEEELEEKRGDDRYEYGEQGNWNTMVSKEPVVIPKLTGPNPKYVARVEHKKNPKMVHTGVAMTQNGAIEDAMSKAQDLSRASTNPDDYKQFNIDFNVEFSNEHIDPRTGNYFKFEQGPDGKPRLIMASKEWFAMYGKDMEDLGFRRAHLRQEAERTGTRFYGFPMGLNKVKSLGLIPNMRYVLAEEEPDADGNSVFRLIADTRYTGIPKRLGEPGFTLAATPKDKPTMDEALWPFGKKAAAVAKPKRWPDRNDDLEQWMRDKIAYLKNTGADPAIVFSPASGDYFPIAFQVGFSYDDAAKRAYANIKREYPDLVKRAREVVSDPLAMRISQSRVGDAEDWPENTPPIRESFPPAIIATLGKGSGGLNSYEVEVKVEDGSRAGLRITASNQQEALQKAMKWAQKEYDHMGVECKIVGINEAKYQGREVKLGKPMAGDVKKYRVYVKNPKTGNVKKVNFGDPNMEIKRDDPKRRKSFRARHGCGTPRASDRTKAAYWACRMWSSKPVSKILKGK